MIKACLSCRRLQSGSSETLRYCACGKSFAGRRCNSCLALSDPEAVACRSCGKNDLSEACPSLDITWIAKGMSLAVTALCLRAAFTHPGGVAGAFIRPTAWLFGTTPCGLLRPLFAFARLGAFLLAVSFLLPAEPGRRLREGLSWCVRSAWTLYAALARLIVGAFRAAVRTDDGKPAQRRRDAK